MKIENAVEGTKVRVISRGKKKAEVIVIQAGAGGSRIHTTRHLQLKLKGWTDHLGNVYVD